VIYSKLTVHARQTDRQTDEVHVETTRKGSLTLAPITCKVKQQN